MFGNSILAQHHLRTTSTTRPRSYSWSYEGSRRCGRPTVSVAYRKALLCIFPIGASGAHQVLNRSAGVVRYLMVGTHGALDIIEYVDDSKVVAYSNADSLLQDELFFWHQFTDDA